MRTSPRRPSAQVKSAVLLAGLHAEGTTSVAEPAATRDHTERALAAFGGHVDVDGLTVSVTGGQRLQGQHALRCPATSRRPPSGWSPPPPCPGSRVEIDDVGLNPTRTGAARRPAPLRRARRRRGRPRSAPASRAARVSVEGDRTGTLDIAPDEVPGLIDELPAIAALAAHGGQVTVRGAAELRVKESDRIAALVAGFRALGIDADERADGFVDRAGRPAARRGPSGGRADARGDHRMAMAFAIAALAAERPSTHRRRRRRRHLLPRLLRDAGAGSVGVKADKIYLVGFMAAGKTTVARALARRLDWQAVDIDELIEQRERQTVADIFSRSTARPTSARVERAGAASSRLPRRHLVVATGGGTFADRQNRAAINADGVSVWLDVPLDRLIARVPADGRRPLAADRAGFERLYHQRRAAYEQAHVRLDAGRASVDALVEQLVDWLEH